MSRLTVAVSLPEQRYDRASKVAWLQDAVELTDCDLFLAPQEYFGGVCMMPDDKHIEVGWVVDTVGALAARTGKAIGVGAAVVYPGQTLGVEEYFYFDRTGASVGVHRKLALPSYDDAAKSGAGLLQPEISRDRRLQPVEMLGLRIGTVFCWEVFSLGLFAEYARRDVTLVVHPIKFAPRAWPRLSPKGGRELRTVIGFDQDVDNALWFDKLVFASKHEVLCPIAVTCNTWALGFEFEAFIGVVDALGGAGFTDVGFYRCRSGDSAVRTFKMDPGLYTAVFNNNRAVLDARHDCRRLRQWTMHRKMRRLGL